MGCTSSKLDDLPAVALCRERCYYLDEAIRHRYAFADSHVAYIHSLKGFAISFDRFFNLHLQDLENFQAPPSPVLNLPPQSKGKGDPDHDHHHPPTPPSAPAVIHPRDSHSNSGSHLHFHSDSEEDDDDDDDDDDVDEDDSDSGSLHHHHNHQNHQTHDPSPSHFHNLHHQDHETLGSMPEGGFMTMNYMQNQATTPSVVYQQRPMSPETVNFGGESSSSSYDPYSSYSNPNPNYYDSSNANAHNPYYNYNYPTVYSNYGGGFYGSAPPYMMPPSSSAASASTSKPPPPPPSPPRASTWDFLNPFEVYERYYPPQTPSRDSREVREEEGIPDLEDEDNNYQQQEVVKEVDGNGNHQRVSDHGGGNHHHNSKNVRDEGSSSSEIDHGGEGIRETKNKNVSVENKGGVEYEVHSVDKNVVANEVKSEGNGNVDGFKANSGSRGVSEVVREIKDQFERASDAGIEVCKILEAGKLPYNNKHSVYHVSSKMLHTITPSVSVVSSQPSVSGSVYSGVDEDVETSLVKLSCTLQKLYIWEKKLYEEVKAEEKIRLIHDRKSRRLKRLDEKGAESQKVDVTRSEVRALSTKIRIAIQVVDKISININKLRDEELLPQINALIHGLVRMWKVMLECHRNQFQAIAELKNLDAFSFNRKPSDAHLEATAQLELDLLNWILRFSGWVITQKAFVGALNSWLRRCLLDEREETVDGMPPFSPGRIGAPHVFVICNMWSQAMERLSEKEVIDTMRVFAMSVHHLCEQHNMELRQSMTANRDLERRVKTLEREEQKMQKALQVVNKQMVMVSGNGSGLSVPGEIVQPSEATNIVSLQSGLKRVFEAMERFTANSMQAYEELRVCSEEERLARENANGP